MKLLDRPNFLKLPAGTIYTMCSEKWAFSGPLFVKGETLPNTTDTWDWCERNLCFIQWPDDGSTNCFDRLEHMLETGTSFPINDDEGREGCFNKGDLFLIYEAADLNELIKVCEAAKGL